MSVTAQLAKHPTPLQKQSEKYPCQHALQAPTERERKRKIEREREREEQQRKRGVDSSQAPQWPSVALGLDAFLRLSFILKTSSCSTESAAPWPVLGWEALLSKNMFGMS